MRLRDLIRPDRRAHRGGTPHLAPRAGRLALSKLCNLEDFAHPELRAVLRAVFAHELDRLGPDFPAGVAYRKHWEVAMAVRALDELGALHDRAEVLGVGAGNEPTVFHLTTRVRRVFATDLYLGGDGWACSANASMLTDPGRHWPAAWDCRRLVVQHMDALDLRYPDDAFDAIFSSSSIEHFGGPAKIRCAMAEMHRVLRPGGVLSLSTEYRLDGPGPGLPNAFLFDADDLRELIVGDLAWEPAEPWDLGLSLATSETEQPFADACDDVRRHVAEHGQLLFHHLDWSRYPHIVLRHGEHLWTSVHVALRKAGG